MRAKDLIEKVVRGSNPTHLVRTLSESREVKHIHSIGILDIEADIITNNPEASDIVLTNSKTNKKATINLEDWAKSNFDERILQKLAKSIGTDKDFVLGRVTINRGISQVLGQYIEQLRSED